MILGGLQKVSLIDYPGKVAAVIFTRGCPLRCHYCHNPGIVLPELFGASAPMEEDKVLRFLESRRGKLEGVVVTGGEPLMHRDIGTFLGKLKAMEYAVKLDTSGVFPSALQAAIKGGLVDYVAMDVKAPFPRYGEVAGTAVKQGDIKRSIEIIRGSGLDYEFRTTVVKGQLSEDDVMKIAESIAGAKRYVLQRFRKSETVDRDFMQRDTYSDEEFEAMRKGAERRVLSCGVR